MTADLVQTAIDRLYDMCGRDIDDIAWALDAEDFDALTAGLEFVVRDSGEGQMMVADLPLGYQLRMTDGDGGMPISVDQYYIGIIDADGIELLGLIWGKQGPRHRVR
jgi:hypothetical protein